MRWDEPCHLLDNRAGGIQLTSAGPDGKFDVATIDSDFNTNGAVLVEFDSTELGAAGNSVSLVVTASNHGATSTSAPTITTVGSVIHVDLNNSTTGELTTTRNKVLITADQLTDPNARLLVKASLA